MSPTVPTTYRRQVQEETARIPETPSVDSSVVLNAIRQRSADTQDAARAISDIGNKVEKHAVKLQALQNEQHTSRLDTDFRQSLQNKLYSPETEAVDVDGQSIERPAGILNRQLGQATGSTTDLDTWYQTERENYLAQVKDPAYRLALEKSLDSSFYTSRDNVLKHEAKQMRSDMVNTFQSELSQKIKDSADAQSPETLQIAIDNVAAAQHKINMAQDADPATSALNINKSVAAAVDTAVVNKLRSTGDIQQAQELLYSMEKSIDLDNYNSIQKKLENGYTAITASRTRLENIKKNDNALGMLSEIASGDINWTNLNKIDEANVPEGFKIAAKNAVQKQIENINNPKAKGPLTVDDAGDVSQKYERFAQHMVDVLNSGDKENILNSMQEALVNFHKGTVSQEQLDILMNLSVARGKNLPIASDVKNGARPPQAQVNFDAGAKSIQDWAITSGNKDPKVYKDYLDEVNAGKDPQAAYDHAVKNAIIKEYPGMISHENMPNAVIGKDSPIRFIFPKTTTVYPSQIYDPKTKNFKPNPNLEKSTKDKK